MLVKKRPCGSPLRPSSVLENISKKKRRKPLTNAKMVPVDAQKCRPSVAPIPLEQSTGGNG